MNVMNCRKNGLWLMSQSDFTPKTWGVVGFNKRGACENFFEKTSNGTIVAIYIIKQNAINKMLAGRVAGFVKLSREMVCSEEFACKELWAKNQKNPKTQNKWSHGIRITQAWKTKEDSCKKVGYIFKNTYNINLRWEYAMRGVPVKEEEDFSMVDGLNIREVNVFGQAPLITNR